MDQTGFLLINKPINYSSFDCIKHIRKIEKATKKDIKIGHAGTLDNFATGLLIIAIGRDSTKDINNLLNQSKEYIATGKIGELTDTLDFTGKIVQKNKKSISKADIKNIIKSFMNNYTQIPPIYSALKFKGKNLYKLAREKKLSEQELEIIIKNKKRTVSIYEISLINYESPYFTIKTSVSKGTYIRSLINDIAEKLGSCATCYKLTRTKIGNIRLDQSINLKDLKTIKDINNNLMNIAFLWTISFINNCFSSIIQLYIRIQKSFGTKNNIIKKDNYVWFSI